MPGQLTNSDRGWNPFRRRRRSDTCQSRFGPIQVVGMDQTKRNSPTYRRPFVENGIIDKQPSNWQAYLTMAQKSDLNRKIFTIFALDRRPPTRQATTSSSISKCRHQYASAREASTGEESGHGEHCKTRTWLGQAGHARKLSGPHETTGAGPHEWRVPRRLLSERHPRSRRGVGCLPRDYKRSL